MLEREPKSETIERKFKKEPMKVVEETDNTDETANNRSLLKIWFQAKIFSSGASGRETEKRTHCSSEQQTVKTTATEK